MGACAIKKVKSERGSSFLQTNILVIYVLNFNQIYKLKVIDFKKLEMLSMLTINKKMEKDLEDVVDVAERMCMAAIGDTESLIYFDYLG